MTQPLTKAKLFNHLSSDCRCLANIATGTAGDAFIPVNDLFSGTTAKSCDQPRLHMLAAAGHMFFGRILGIATGVTPRDNRHFVQLFERRNI